MKNNILIFLLGVFVTISIAATVPNTGLLTVKPAKPRSTLVLYNRDYMNWKNYIYQGYQVKSASAGTDGGYIIVMEKY